MAAIESQAATLGGMGTEFDIEAAKRFNTTVGKTIRAAAAYDGKSIKQLSRDTGIDYVTLGRYLKGQRDIPIPIIYRCSLHLATNIRAIISDAYIATWGAEPE